MTAEVVAASLFQDLLFLILLYAVQFYLCSRKNPWMGLILPGSYFVYSLYLLIRVFVLHPMQEYSVLLRMLGAFISPNLNTVVLLLIYYFSRKKAE